MNEKDIDSGNDNKLIFILRISAFLCLLAGHGSIFFGPHLTEHSLGRKGPFYI